MDTPSTYDINDSFPTATEGMGEDKYITVAQPYNSTMSSLDHFNRKFAIAQEMLARTTKRPCYTKPSREKRKEENRRKEKNRRKASRIHKFNKIKR